MKKLVVLTGLLAVIGLTAPASLTLAASKSRSPSMSAPGKVTIKPPSGKTVVRPPGKGGFTPRPGKVKPAAQTWGSVQDIVDRKRCRERCDRKLINCLPPSTENPFTSPATDAIGRLCDAAQSDCYAGCNQRH